jgi:hypothetical protein
VNIDCVLAIKCRGVAVVVVDGAVHRNGRIIDEDIEPSEMPGDVFHQLIDFAGTGLVRLEGARFDALGL